jgi:uncharacterized protein YraI
MMNYLRKRIKDLSPRSLVATLLILAVVVGAAAGVSRAAPLLQTSGAMAVAAYDQVNIRSGPSTAYAVVGSLVLGQSCPIIGRDTSTGWWLIACANGVTGWVSPDVVTVVGDTSNVPSYTVGGSAIVAPPEPQAPSQPTTFTGWQASYFANADLSGVPVLVQDVPDINFDWGYGSPSPSVPVDNFSARYARTLNLAPGNYLLTLRMDDGARVFIDSQLVMNDWRVGSVRELYGQPLLCDYAAGGAAYPHAAATALPALCADAVGAAGPVARPILQQHRVRRFAGSRNVRAPLGLPTGSELGDRFACAGRQRRLLLRRLRGQLLLCGWGLHVLHAGG